MPKIEFLPIESDFNPRIVNTVRTVYHAKIESAMERDGTID